MRKSTFVFFAMVPCAVIAAIMIYNQHRTRGELDELRASLRTTADSPERQAGDQSIPKAAEIGRMLARAAIAASEKTAQPDPASAASSDQAKPPEKHLTQQEVTENVLASFATEIKDPEWSRQALEKIDGPIREALPPGSRILSTDCRATMCVVQIQHQDAAAAQAWLLPGLRSWPGAIFIPGIKEDNGALVQTIIPIKEGATPAYAGL